MQHIAIMKKSWKLTDKILSGEKKIESRWYKSKHAPWDKIKTGEIIYFKNSGEPVNVCVEVSGVLQFSKLNSEKVMDILRKYGKDIGINDLEYFHNLNKGKKYCILIFLKNIKKITPFDINKKGFGNMAAWICVEDIKKIKK